MRPQTVTAGPFAAASATNVATAQRNLGAGAALAIIGTLSDAVATTVCASQSPGAAAFTINGTRANTGVAYLESGKYIYITSGGNDSGITFAVVGTSGLNNIVVRETLTGSNTQSVASNTLYNTILSITPSGAVAGTVTVGSFTKATPDVSRRLLFSCAGNEAANTAVITGTNYANTDITETLTLAGAAATVTSVMDYKTVSKIKITNAAAGNISVGTTAGTTNVITNPVAASPWTRFDGFAGSNVNIQCVVSGAGTINYVIQTSNDDPNSEGVPIAAQNMTWSLSPDAAVGTAGTPATGTVVSSFTTVPVFARVLVEFVNTTTVSVAMTSMQTGVAPY